MDAHKSGMAGSFQVVSADGCPHTREDGREALRDEGPREAPFSKEREASRGAAPLGGAYAAAAPRGTLIHAVGLLLRSPDGPRRRRKKSALSVDRGPPCSKLLATGSRLG